MRRRNPSPSLGRSRSGYTLVMFALLLPVLLGMLGLVIDCGLLMAAQRQVQNAADAAAMAAAMAKLSGNGDPQAVATTFVTQYNGLPNATLTAFNNPPSAGPHAGRNSYYEVVVTVPVTTLFMPALGANSNQSVQARAVAGSETVPAGELVAALDPTAPSGLTVTGGASLVVNGRIIVNSPANPAATVTGGGQVQAAVYNIAGPAVSGTFNPYPGTSGQLLLNQPPMGDPLINLPTPATAANTANNTATPPGPAWSTQLLGSPAIVGDGIGNASGLQPPNYFDSSSGPSGTVQLYPGVYQSIQITGGTVNFNPGVYILSPPTGTTYSLYVTGGTSPLSSYTRVTGNGVMFYNTGGDFDPTTGLPDYNDASQYDPGPSGINAPPSGPSFQDDFADTPSPLDGTKNVLVNSSNPSTDISLSGLSDAGGPFRGILFYQRRANTQTIYIYTGAGNLSLTGMLYAKWAQFNILAAASSILGGGSNPQFIGGSMRLAGQATLTLNYGSTLNIFGRANEVFLVE